MRRRIPIDVDVEGEGPLLIQLGDVPIFESENDTDLVCALCEQPLARGVHIGQVRDLRLQCGGCGAILRTPNPEPQLGMTLKTIKPGRYVAHLTQALETQAVYISPRAHEQQTERLRRIAGLDKDPGSFNYADPEHLRAVLARLQHNLGKVYDEIATRERYAQVRERGKVRHVLGNAILRTEDTMRTVHDGKSPIYIVEIMEVARAAEMLERWSNQNGAPTLAKSFLNPHEYPHSMLVLIFAGHLARAKNDVRLLPPEQGARACDMRLQVTREHAVMVEVKVPERLRTRGAFHESAAKNIVEGAIKKAGTGEGDQLDPRRPGVLLIGGYHLNDRALDALMESATRVITDRGRRRTHLAGVGLMSLGIVGRLRDPPEGRKAIDVLGEEIGPHSFIGTLGFRWIANTHYAGDVRLFSSDGLEALKPDDTRDFYKL